jgi:hypothetical protein
MAGEFGSARKRPDDLPDWKIRFRRKNGRNKRQRDCFASLAMTSWCGCGVYEVGLFAGGGFELLEKLGFQVAGLLGHVLQWLRHGFEVGGELLELLPVLVGHLEEGVVGLRCLLEVGFGFVGEGFAAFRDLEAVNLLEAGFYFLFGLGDHVLDLLERVLAGLDFLVDLGDLLAGLALDVDQGLFVFGGLAGINNDHAAAEEDCACESAQK